MGKKKLKTENDLTSDLKKFNCNQICNILHLNKINREVVKIKFKSRIEDVSTWETLLKDNKII